MNDDANQSNLVMQCNFCISTENDINGALNAISGNLLMLSKSFFPFLKASWKIKGMKVSKQKTLILNIMYIELDM